MNKKANLILLLFAMLFALPGCWGDPEIHPVSGKVTLKGKSYNRLLIYFRPVDAKVNKFNMGVGETDGTGKMKIRSTAGLGLAAGKYRVSFSCIQPKNAKNRNAVDPNEKNDDDPSVKLVELVPEPYDEEKNANTSPKIFEVKAGDNVFDFDIPGK